MPYNVLFPFKNESKITDFAAVGNGARGWIETDPNDEKILDKMARCMSGSGADLDDRDSAIMSIPSPIAYVLDFIKQLKDNAPNAVNEWRSLLAAIALQKLNGIQIDIKEYTIKAQDGTAGKFRKIVGAAFEKNASIVGYDMNGKVDPNKLYVFSKDGKPFAMYLPSIVICPFKEYDRTIFNSLPWCEKDGKWKEVLACGDLDCRNPVKNLNEREVAAQKLYCWLESLEEEIRNNNGDSRQITAFKDAIFKPDGVYGAQPVNPGGMLEPWSAANNKTIYNALRSICAVPDWAPKKACSDKLLLLIVPEEPKFDHDDLDSETLGSTFIPQAISMDKEQVYVIPPIDEEVVKSLEKGAKIATEGKKGWTITYNADDSSFSFQYKLIKDGNTIPYSAYYSSKDVYWIADLPYISMWPNVKFKDIDAWNNYLVSIFMKRDGAKWNNWNGQLAEKMKKVESIKENQLIGYADDNNSANDNVINIAVFSGDDCENKEFKCESNCTFEKGSSSQEFKMIQSKSAPRAISFSYKGNTLGCWMIEWADRDEVSIDGNKTAIIGMDFGTTSTNVYIKMGNGEGAIPESIYSPSHYVRDIYNPCPGKNDAGLFQRYYLFGASDSNHNDGKLGKIFTYGQNFKARNVNQISIIPNITGRFVDVDNSYIVSENGDNDKGIYSGLKWSTDDTNHAVARENFVNSILMFAILEARAKGASGIEVRLSYPARNLGNSISGSLQNELLQDYVGNDCSLVFKGSTEARCAGRYYEKVGQGKGGIRADAGYSIIDIGGGTTDVSFIKSQTANAASEVKAEHTFKIAGIEIIEKTFIDFFDGKNKIFKEFWVDSPNGESDDSMAIKAAIEKFNTLSRVTAGDNALQLNRYYQKKGAILNFLLENGTINSRCYGTPQYVKLFQAIRTKYYVLFWLVANFLKINDDVSIDPRNKVVACLAGCGSKGYDMCKQTVDEKEITKSSCMAYINFLGFNKNDVKTAMDRFKIVQPLGESKEEVAYGLCLLNDNDTADIQNINARLRDKQEATDYDGFIPDTDNEEVDSSNDDEQIKKIETSLDAEGEIEIPNDADLKEAVKDLLRVVGYLEVRDSELIKDVKGHFDDNFDTFSNDVIKAIGDSESNVELYKKVYAALMLYSMINEEL